MMRELSRCSSMCASQPADARDREGRREQLLRQADRVEQHRGVELDVRGHAPLGAALAERRDGDALDRAREVEPVAAQLARRRSTARSSTARAGRARGTRDGPCP